MSQRSGRGRRPRTWNRFDRFSRECQPNASTPRNSRDPNSAVAGCGSIKVYNSGFMEEDGLPYREKLRHPPELKGRAIGLWYAARSRGRRLERNTNCESHLQQSIKMDRSQFRSLSDLLSLLQSDIVQQPFKSYTDYSSDSDTDSSIGSEFFDCVDDGGGDEFGQGSQSCSSEDDCSSASIIDTPCQRSSNSIAETVDDRISAPQIGNKSWCCDTKIKLEPCVETDFTASVYNDGLTVKSEPVTSHSDDDFSAFSEPSCNRAENAETFSDLCDDVIDVDCSPFVIKSEDTDEVTECLVDVKTFQPPLESSSTWAGLVQDNSIDHDLQQENICKMQDEKFKAMMEFRQKLPSYRMKQEIIECIAQNQVIVISGETGCGKTTQVPQFILDDYIERGQGSLCRIVCTQPRRISAISIAERVAAERAEPLGNSTGFQIRLESKLPRTRGSILFCTTGIMLRWLVSDPALSSTSHVILDEIHERDVLSDFLMVVIRDLTLRRKDLKVILMSATLNAQDFANYFYNCTMLTIPGFTFPVEQYLLEDVIEILQYNVSNIQPQKTLQHFEALFMSKQQQFELENKYKAWIRQLKGYSSSTVAVLNAMSAMGNVDIDIQLVASLIHHITCKKAEGAILVFVPGWDQIKKLTECLQSREVFTSAKCRIIPLHSLMPTVNQREVFERPPLGVRKIVIATNIAETSITIDDVVYVIDCGKIKMKNFDPVNNIATLMPQWVSRANAKQRSGRAGRVQRGECYHLYTAFHEQRFNDYQLPEMLRTRLEELCLQIKLLKLGNIKPFIAKAMQPPSNDSVDLAIKVLIDLNALDGQTEELTPLGCHLAQMPVEPHIGKMLLYAALFSCVDPISSIAASLSYRDAFYIPLGREKDADATRCRLADDSHSDHIMLANAFSGWRKAKTRGTDRQFCWDNFLSANTLKMIENMKSQFTQLLYDMGFLSDPSPMNMLSNQNSNNMNVVKAVICAGLYPNVIQRLSPFRMSTKSEPSVHVHPKSVNSNNKALSMAWLVYYLKLKTRQINVHDCGPVSPYSLLLFGGNCCIFQDKRGHDCVTIDDWIKFRCNRAVAYLLKRLRAQLDRLVERLITNPSVVSWTDSRNQDTLLMNTVVNLLTSEVLHIPSETRKDDRSGAKRNKHGRGKHGRGNFNRHGRHSHAT